jgi:predicted nuclease of predicted toxin-antitoxin system
MSAQGFLLDLGVACQVLEVLRGRGINAVHAAELGMSSATDAALIRHAVENDLVVITTDTGCANLVARSGALAPSVITLRLDNPNGAEQVAAIEGLMGKLGLDDLQGCVVSLERERFRKRALPPLG